MSENDIQKAILQWLWYNKIFSWRNNSGALRTQSGGFIRFGAVGSPDIFAVINGRIIGIEVKSKKGKQTESQKDFQKELENAGGMYILARSVDDILYLNSL